MQKLSYSLMFFIVMGASMGYSQDVLLPGLPEENGLTPLSKTIYINVGGPDALNNGGTESLGVAIANNGNVIVGWEDDGDGPLKDLEAVWTMFDGAGQWITPETTVKGEDQTGPSKFLAYFRSDGSAVSGYTAWGPKIKANLFGDGVGMGATAFSLGLEIPELADINMDAGGGGDFPAVQLLTNDGKPISVLSGVSDEAAETEGDIRIGDWDYLSNGNIVIVGESRQSFELIDLYNGEAAGNHAIYRIVDPTGKEIRPVGLVSEVPNANEIWHGVGVTKNGFAVRFSLGGRAIVRLFDNAGEPVTGNIDIGELTGEEITAGGGRGDGTGFHGNGVDAYAVVNSGDGDGNGAKEVHLTVINADGSLRYHRVATNDFEFSNSDRVDCAIDPAGRVIVVFSDNDVTGLGFSLAQARLFDAAGEPLSGTFFVSENETLDLALDEARRPRVALRNNMIAIVWESKSSGETTNRVVALRLFKIEGGTAIGDYELY
ncbi:MAG: hypothetical protein AB1656_21720 [Candidatus Omnitrophota bacterium]